MTINIQEFIRENSLPLNLVLTNLAAQIHCDANELIAYAQEDTVGGYHIDEAKRKWPQGSMWHEEGVLLYVLTRHLKPDLVAEIGGWTGCSATHFATALRANGKGHLISVDNGVGGQPHGYMIPDELRSYVTLVNEDGRVWLAAQPAGSIGILLEDADHSTELVMEITRLALAKVEAGGIIASHDAMHKFARIGGGQIIPSPVGDAVQEGLQKAGAYFTGYLVAPSDCGLGITVVPGVKVSKPIDVSYHSNTSAVAGDHLAALSQVGNANIESVSEPPAPIETTNDPVVPKSQQVSKPRGKGKRKPKA